MRATILFLAAALAYLLHPQALAAETLNLIPLPKVLDLQLGRLELTSKTRVVAAEARLRPLAEVLSGEIYRVSGLRLSAVEAPAASGDIALRIDPGLRDEQYALDVGQQAVCRGGNYQAVAWSTVTLLQALQIGPHGVALPKMSVKDRPDFPFRSAMTDIARKWHPLVNLHELVDLFRFYKVRNLQFHLNDHGMFTFGSKKFPKLPTEGKTGRHYYTIEELKELVAYADARGVTLIPEIEMPGHSDAGRLMPEIFGTKDPSPASGHAGPYRSAGMVNLTRDDTIEACGQLLDEVMGVFASSPYVSIGADEVARPAIARIPEYEAFCQRHGLKNPGEVYHYFIARMNERANRAGKTLMTYGQGGPKNVLQMPWVGNDDTFTREGYKVVRYMGGSVTQHMVTFCEPPYNTIMLYSSFNERIYNADYRVHKDRPIPNPENVFGVHILSWQNWHFVTFADFRRTMAVVAENTWNHERKQDRRPWEAWKKTWQATDQRLDDLVFPVKVEAEGLLSPGDIVFHKSLTLRLRSARPGVIRYRMEPLDYFSPPALPDAASPIYQEAITITRPTVIYAALFDHDGRRIGYGAERRYWPIVPKLVCRVYDGPAVDEAVRKQRAAEVGAKRPYPDFAAQSLPPVLTFPLGRLTFQPSHEGVYFQSSYLVMDGRIKVPADGDYQFFCDGSAEVLIDGQLAACGPTVKTKKKSAGQVTPENRKLHLTAGAHRLAVFTDPGNKGQSVARFQGPGMDKPKSLDVLLAPLAENPK
jgi:hexosaminidase